MLYNIFKKFNISDGLVEKFMKIYGMLRLAQSIGKKKPNLPGLTSMKEALKTCFLCGAPDCRIISVEGGP